MSTRDDIGNRMKRYEQVNTNFLLRRTPVLIRIDGKAFHTWTRHCEQPFDANLHNIMRDTMHYLCDNIQNAVYGYTQSDEISILLCDWLTLNTEQWFDGNIQKIASVSASLATGCFNHFVNNHGQLKYNGLAFFDARVFNIPFAEVHNYFLWRQQDATRNSIQTYARSFFSHKELHKKSCNNIQQMLFEQHDVNWNDLDVWKKRGSHIYRVPDDVRGGTWVRDTEMSIIDGVFRESGPINTYLKIG